MFGQLTWEPVCGPAPPGLPDGEVVVMGRGALTRLYSAALTQCGRPNFQVDGEEAFLAGTNAIVERLQ